MGREQPPRHFGIEHFKVLQDGSIEKPTVIPDLAYAITATNANADNHGKKRVGLSFIYLMLIRKLASEGLLKSKLKKVDAGLQARTSPQQTFQEAHQILGEIGCGKDALYDIAINAGDKRLSRALAYCSAATTTAHESVNHADSWLEKQCRDAFCELANEIRKSPNMDPGTIWLRLISVFENGCHSALQKVKSGGVHKNQSKHHIEKVLEGYLKPIAEFRARVNNVQQRDAEYWIQHILVGGYGDPVIGFDNASAYGASGYVMGQSVSAPPPKASPPKFF